MALMTGAITALSLIGTPGQIGERPLENAASDSASLSVTESAVVVSVRAGYEADFTRLGTSGVPARLYASFTKSAAVLVELAVSDSAVISAVEDPVDEQFFETTDVATLFLSETAQLFNNVGVTDTAAFSIAEGISLEQSGTVEQNVTETASLSLTEDLAIDVSLDVTDDASISVDDQSTLDVATVEVGVSDTTSLVLTEDVVLNVFAGALAIDTVDDVFISITEVATLVAGSRGTPPKSRVYIAPVPGRTHVSSG